MNKVQCDYCNGVTYDDERGNCIACGAPRSAENVRYSYTGIDQYHNPYPYPHMIGFGNMASTCGVDVFYAST
jgi:ribosomal protein L37E